MKLKVISSGSKGNCYLLQADSGSLLLDVGVSPKHIHANVILKSLDACLVTHEHKDHSKSAQYLLSLGIPVFASDGTSKAAGLSGEFLRIAKSEEAGIVRDWTIMPFAVQHDAAEPLGFFIRYEPTKETILYATDTFYLRYVFDSVNYWIVECNYDDEIVSEQIANEEIQERLMVRLNRSHMSTRRLIDTLLANDLTEARKIVLVHLSDSRSDEKRMVADVYKATGIETVAASDGMEIEFELVPF
jgi:phosphoribosyl 1,2-cyclic phosphodiesterase